MNKNQLSRVKIRGYKSINDCDVSLNMINVLIGSNGAGKSNFISAFSFLNTVLKEELQHHVATAGGASVFLYNGSKETTDIVFDFSFGDYAYEFSLKKTDNENFLFQEELFKKGKVSQSLKPSFSMESRWKNGTGYEEVDNNIIPILSKGHWKVYHFQDTSRNAKVKTMCHITNNESLSFDAGNLSAYLYRLKTGFEKEYNSIVGTIRLIAPYFSDFILTPTDGGNILLKWRQKGSDDSFNANQLSDGTLRFICLVTLLLQPMCLQSETIIIDEPELGLHPYAITIFAELVKKVSSKKQIIISTQSVELLNEFNPEDIIVTSRNGRGTVFKRLDANELNKWLEDDYSLGELWKKNILGGRLSK